MDRTIMFTDNIVKFTPHTREEKIAAKRAGLLKKLEQTMADFDNFQLENLSLDELSLLYYAPKTNESNSTAM